MGQRQRAWESNQVAGATIHRRHEAISPRLGRVYGAHNQVTGNPVLVVAPGQQGEWGHLPTWRMQLAASTQEGCYTLELEEAPTGRGLPELTLALYRLSRALAQVEDRPEAAAELLGPLAEAGRARVVRRRRAQWGGAGVALAAVALLAVGNGQMKRFVDSEGEAEQQPVALGEVGALAAPVGMAPRQLSAPGVWLDMPRKPWPGQNLAPCERPETELKLSNGQVACWVKVDYSPEDCKGHGYEYKGGCYLPSYPPPKAPQSGQ